MPDLPVKTPEQLVTLASIVEKETGKPDERTRVAAVFVNRLQDRMRASVRIRRSSTGWSAAKARSASPIMKSEIEQPTPCTIPMSSTALPPGPIANPGRASLEAAANPARTKELYFVADGTGWSRFLGATTPSTRRTSRVCVASSTAAAMPRRALADSAKP